MSQMRLNPVTGKMEPWDRRERAQEVERRRAEIRAEELKNGKVTAPKQVPMFDEELRTIAQEHEVGDLLVTPQGNLIAPFGVPGIGKTAVVPMFEDEIARENEVHRTMPVVLPGGEVTTVGNLIAPRTAFVSDTLAELRQKWVQIGPSKRSGATGDKLMKQYRKLSLEFWQLTGKHPPLIHADM